MFLSWSDILLILAQAAVGTLAAMLMVAAVSRLPRTAFWQALALASPALAATLGVYYLKGVTSAVTLLISASVGAMLLCNGAAVLMAKADAPDTPSAGAVAGLIFPVGIVLLLGGFAAHFTGAQVVGLTIVGVLAMDMLRGEAGSPTMGNPGKVGPGARALAWCVLPLAGFVLAFATIAVLKAVTGALIMVHSDAFVVMLIAPAVTLPLLMHAMRSASMAQLTTATRMTGSVACLLLGIALPLLVLADYAMALRTSDTATPAGLPAVSWRLDSPLLVMAGFAMLGMRLGFIRPDRWVAMLLIFVYLLYVLTATLLRIG